MSSMSVQEGRPSADMVQADERFERIRPGRGGPPVAAPARGRLD